MTLLGELHEIVIATLTPPRLRTEDETEMELETGVVGEGGEAAESAAGEAEEAAGDGGETPSSSCPSRAAARPLTGSSSGSAIRAANTRGRGTTSASRWSNDSPRAGI